jgi:hypothetical protein
MNESDSLSSDFEKYWKLVSSSSSWTLPKEPWWNDQHSNKETNDQEFISVNNILSIVCDEYLDLGRKTRGKTQCVAFCSPVLKTVGEEADFSYIATEINGYIDADEIESTTCAILDKISIISKRKREEYNENRKRKLQAIELRPLSIVSNDIKESVVPSHQKPIANHKEKELHKEEIIIIEDNDENSKTEFKSSANTKIETLEEEPITKSSKKIALRINSKQATTSYSANQSISKPMEKTKASNIHEEKPIRKFTSVSINNPLVSNKKTQYQNLTKETDDTYKKGMNPSEALSRFITSTSSGVKTNKDTKTESNSFICPLCLSSFARYESMKKHLTTCTATDFEE